MIGFRGVEGRGRRHTVRNGMWSDFVPFGHPSRHETVFPEKPFVDGDGGACALPERGGHLQDIAACISGDIHAFNACFAGERVAGDAAPLVGCAPECLPQV
jgi:hypothetical protein